MSYNSLFKVAVITLGLLLPFCLSAQDSNLGNWLIYIGNKKIDSKWNLHHEVQYRNYNAIGDLEQLLLRTGVGYAVADRANLLLGYGYILSQNYTGTIDEKVSIGEHRIFQQFITKNNANKLSFQHRYRFEQRFVEDQDMKLRFRYFLGLNYPLATIDDESGKALYLSAYNEIFLNSRANVFDRNRLYGGLGYKLSPKIKMELGYMNQFLSNGNRDQINLLLFANF